MLYITFAVSFIHRTGADHVTRALKRALTLTTTVVSCSYLPSENTCIQTPISTYAQARSQISMTDLLRCVSTLKISNYRRGFDLTVKVVGRLLNRGTLQRTVNVCCFVILRRRKNNASRNLWKTSTTQSCNGNRHLDISVS